MDAADWVTDYFNRHAKVLILSFFTFAAMC